MYRVVDTIAFNNRWIHHYPRLAERGEGLLVILDPEQIREPPAVEGRTVVVERPDGSTSELTVHSVEAGANSMVGLFFKDVSSDAVTCGSLIRW